MTTSEQLREWLRKMQYPDPNPSDETLQRLCRGSMGPIFQQIIDRVKPKQKVEHTRKAIIVNKLTQNGKLNLNPKCDHNIEQLKSYNEKCKLEKQLQEITAQNIEDEASLEYLKSRVKSKSAKYQPSKERLKELEKDIVLYRAKTEDLEKQMESCQKLHDQSKILKTSNPMPNDKIPEKMEEVLSNIQNVIRSFKSQSGSSSSSLTNFTTLTTISENTSTFPFQTSIFSSSNKRPLSTIKKVKRANQTKKHLAFMTNSQPLITSTSRKKNTSKVPFISSFNSILSSSNSSIAEKNEIVKDLEQLCLGNKSVMKIVQELWESDCEYVFKLLLDMVVKHKNEIAEMVAKDDIGSKNYFSKSACGMEELYSFHVQTELKRMVCQQEQHKIKNMLENMNIEDIPYVTVLKANEQGLKAAIDHARNKIKELQQDLPNNSDKLDQILDKIENRETEIASVKSKIEVSLSILQECNSWMNRQHKNILENIRKPQIYSEHEMLKCDLAVQDVQKFIACPIQSQKTHYLNNWTKIYTNPELLEIIQYPFLSPENVVKFFTNQENWLHKLQLLQKENNEEIKYKLAVFDDEYDEKQITDYYDDCVEQLKASASICSKIAKSAKELDNDFKYYLESPLNNCVAPNVKYEDKTLKEYCEIYDSYYNQLL